MEEDGGLQPDRGTPTTTPSLPPRRVSMMKSATGSNCPALLCSASFLSDKPIYHKTHSPASTVTIASLSGRRLPSSDWWFHRLVAAALLRCSWLTWPHSRQLNDPSLAGWVRPFLSSWTWKDERWECLPYSANSLRELLNSIDFVSTKIPQYVFGN